MRQPRHATTVSLQWLQWLQWHSSLGNQIPCLQSDFLYTFII